MTGAEVRSARYALGQLWGLERPLHAAELGRVLGLRGDRPGQTVIGWEAKPREAVTGPVSRALEAWLGGFRPPDLDEALGR